MIRALLSLLFVFSLGCDQGITVRNVSPEITAIGPVTLQADGTVVVYVWIRDHEEDAVDIVVEVAVVVKGQNSTTELKDLGGHGTIGLTSSRDGAGRLHQLVWTPDNSIGDTDKIKLVVTPTDRQGGAGDSFASSEFTLQDGLPSP